MSDHKISPNGLSIECHAAPDAACRKRPDCEAELWVENWCEDHDGEHPVTGGHDCWQLPWVNSTSLDETYDGPGAPVTIYPGRAVVIEWSGDDCSWHYAHQEGGTMTEQPPTARRWLTTTEEIEALRAGSIVRSKMGIVRERFSTGWMPFGWDKLLTSAQMAEIVGGHELLHDGATDE